MRAPSPRAGRARRRILTTLLLIAGALGFLLLGGPGRTTPHASGQGAGSQLAVQTDASVAASGVIFLGSSPEEAPGETWGIGKVGSLNNPTWTIVRYAEGAGWSTAQMLDSQGQPLARFAPDESPLTGAVTPSGAGALLGTASGAGPEPSEASHQVLLVRKPGGAFQEVAPVPEALLGTGQTLFSGGRAPLLASLDEGGSAGALVVPIIGGPTGSENGVLHWDGHEWTREEVELSSEDEEGFRVLGIGASSASNAWLLGQLPDGVALFHRQPGSKPVWKPVAPTPGGAPGERLSVEGEPFTARGAGQPPSNKTQALTVTAQGVWVDGERTDAHTPVTMFFKPEGQDHGQVTGSWCNLPPGTPGGTQACKFGLPDSLPGTARSFAWANGSTPYGERVISGLPEDVTLRLEGSSFRRVLALGASESGTFGGAFSEPEEGWLGDASLPVHLTRHPAPNRLEPYPVPFRFALLAIAPQPGAPVGALTSQALAVGDNGEVARYAPGQGWEPESLLGAGGRRATPRLRAVAWPTPTRSFAVGELGQMWLWRGETRLWERDPAAPRNFRGNLLGIAFDPNNAGRGYAVGQGGVLLRYGKSWSQDALPPEVAGASFTSIAFAGSEAIVAFRIPQRQGGVESYSGGLLVNGGSGWHVDQAAASALAPAGGIPWTVAGLPDGGAALSGETVGGEPLVMERAAQGGAWEPTPVPYPRSATAPGSLALFRENGALRMIGSGAIPNTRETDFPEPPAPAGLPENLIKPYLPATGHVLRQTASGWSDEEHERNISVGNPANYTKFDLPYEPDPTAGVLVDETGSLGWAVGGEIETVQQGRLDTADIARYPADGSVPPGIGTAPVQVQAGSAAFAIGGDAQCAAPCADRENDKLGPDLWLATALAQAGQIPGLRAFLDLGPRLTTGETSSKKTTQEIPYTREFERYANLLRSSSIPAHPVVASTDIAGGAGECLFDQAFEYFAWASSTSSSSEHCSAQSGYYAFDSGGATGTVRVIVLDETSSADATQRSWLDSELGAAAAGGIPAIVLGSDDLSAEIAAGDPAASALASVLVRKSGASAYFYDSPERNVQAALRVGSEAIPSFGSGTLGYVLASNAAKRDFVGHSGFLLAEVDAEASARDSKTLRWPVSARLIPNIGELALEAQDGVLLRRSQPGLFAGLARRPRAGCVTTQVHCETSPYIPIPANCVGAACASRIAPEYTFSSSRPDIGDFVTPNLASPDPHAVLLNPTTDKPIHDAKSGLFCAYNAGTTVVTISAGGLSSSLSVTVQAGSVRRPCGTQPLKETAASAQAAGVPPPAPAPAPSPAGPAPASSPTPLPIPPAPPVPASPVPPPTPHPAPAPFFLPQLTPAPLLAFVPPPVPTPARPTPPSGTSAVTSPIEVAEHEEEEEEATESVSNQAVAYRASDYEPNPAYVLGIILLAAFAGASVRRRPRRDRRAVRVAAASTSASGDSPRSPRRVRRYVNRW